MKIALIGRYGEGDIVAGPERVAREHYSELRKCNLHVVFIEYFFSGYKSSSIIKKIFGIKISKDGEVIRLGIFPFILKLYREKFEIIHIINHQRFILFLFFIKPFIRSKLITTYHGLVRHEIPGKKYLRKRYFIDLWLEKLTVKKSDLLIFPSMLLLETFKGCFKISNKKFQIIPNGVSNIFFNHDTSFPRIKDSIKLVFYNGFGGSINKGLYELVELLQNVKYKIELYVIGHKANVNTYEKIKIVFIEPKSHLELIKFLKDKHFIIKSLPFDTFAIMVAECMLLGLIPIVNENIGIKDFIQHKENGFIYNSSSADELVNLINDIFGGKYDLNLISDNAKKIYEQLTWSKITEQYISAYESI